MILDGRAPESVAQAVRIIRAGGLLGLPTETVYGLAADADSNTAVARIFAAKGRPSDHPLIVHVADLDQGQSGVAHYCSALPDFARALMAAFWPGPLTLILPRRAEVAAAAAGGQGSVGLRCPSHPVAQAVLRALRVAPDGEPLVWGLAAPSANQFGRVSPTTAAHVQDEFGPELLILDGGACPVGIESTIIDCTRGMPVQLRPGAITREQAQRVCGQPVLLKEELPAHMQQGPRASGTLESHYAPKARVRLMDARALQSALNMLGADMDAKTSAPVIAVYSRAVLATPSARVLRRRMPDDAEETAHQLFAVLREFDAQGVKLIWVEELPASPEWDGVRDRLQRASAQNE